MRISLHIDIPDDVLAKNNVQPEQVIAEFRSLKDELKGEAPEGYKFILEITESPK